MAKTQNIFSQSKVNDLFLLQLLRNAQKDLECLNPSLQISKTLRFGNLLVAVDTVTIIILDIVTGKEIRCPAIGEMLHVEQLPGDQNYNVYYKVSNSQLVVDTIIQGKFEGRRDLLSASKYPVAKVSTSKHYILIIDYENNISVVNKKDLFTNSMIKALKATSFLDSRNEVTSMLSRLMSSKFECELLKTDDTTLTLYIVAGSSKTLYKLDIDPRSMLAKGNRVKLGSMSKANSFDFEALHTFLLHAQDTMMSLSKIKILSACTCGERVVVSVYNSDKKEYEHRILNTSGPQVKLECKFVTDKSFIVHRVVEVVSSGQSKFITLEFNSSKSKISYAVVNGSCEIESRGESKSSEGDCDLLSTLLVTELETVSEEEITQSEEDTIE